MKRSRICHSAACLALLLSASAASASFHLMQIEQVMAGACGDPQLQVIQLRMRALGQNLVSGKKLIAHDAAGANPVVVMTFPSNVTTSTAGSRILIASAAAASALPNRDFVMTGLIPTSYLAAGKLTFEDEIGTVYWSIAWGGASYTGTNMGSMSNDADGNFSPAFASTLPGPGNSALVFTGAAAALSTNNAADYITTPGLPTFTNNAGTAALFPDCLFFNGFETGGTTGWTVVVP